MTSERSAIDKSRERVANAHEHRPLQLQLPLLNAELDPRYKTFPDIA